jgi:hypothetical protein
LNKQNKDKLAAINRLIDWYRIHKPTVTEIYTGMSPAQIEQLEISLPEDGPIVYRGMTLKTEMP